MANPQGRKLDRVRLSAPERRELQAIVDGTGAAWRRRRAQILRMADEGRDGGKLRDVDIARGLGIGASTVGRLCKRCVLEGLEAALRRREPFMPPHLTCVGPSVMVTACKSDFDISAPTRSSG